MENIFQIKLQLKEEFKIIQIMMLRKHIKVISLVTVLYIMMLLNLHLI
jgi:hypothetical protein